MSMHICFGCGVVVPHRTLCQACSRKRFEEVREEVRAVCLSDTAHGGPIPPQCCDCQECKLASGWHTGWCRTGIEAWEKAARAVVVIVALALAACAHPDARPRHYSADSGSGKP